MLSEQVRALYAKAHLALVAVLVNAGLLVGVLWNARSKTVLLGWAAALAVLTLLRAHRVRSYQRAAVSPDTAAEWGRAFFIGTLLNGILWGAGGVLLYVPDALPYQVMVVFVLGGMCAGAVTSTSSYPKALYAFIVPCFAPLSIRMLFELDAVHIAMSAMLALFAGLLMGIGRTGSRQLMENVRLRIEREALASNLAATKSQLEDANRALSLRVEERSTELAATRADKQRSEAALQRFRAILDQAKTAIFVAEAETLELIDHNRSALALVGTSGDEAVGKSMWTLGIADELTSEARWRELVRSLRIERQLTIEASDTMERSDARLLEVSLALESFDGTDYVLAVVYDATERKVLERELAQSQLLARVGSLATGVAHEINNPLAYIVSNLEFARESLPCGTTSSEVIEAIGEAREGAERIRSIVGDLTALSHRDAVEIAALDINALLRSCIKLVSTETRHRARIIEKLDPVPPVYGERTRLSQVFLNLLTNAAQAIEPGNYESNTIEVSTYLTPEHEIAVEVSDTGCGMPRIVRERIFEPFFTTKDVGQGTGLGLSLSKTIIESFNGSISVESKEGHGTTFYVHLGAAPDDTPAPSTERRRSTDLPPHSPAPARILIVDDDRLVARSLVRALRAHHTEVINTPQEALEKLRQQPDAFDIVFCDVLMPDLGGPALYRKVRELSPEASDRFIFITGAASPDATRFLDGISNECVRKPFDVSEVLRLVRKRMARR